MAINAKQLRQGALWTYAQSAASTIGQFLVGVILARLLTPSDFGLFIAVTAFTTILLNLAQSGLSAAILQAKTLNDEHTNAAFWTVTLISALCIALLVLCAQPLAKVYDAPGFSTVMYVMCLAFILIPYNSISLALLRRRMQFDLIAVMAVQVMVMVSAIEILAALLGAGVYSLVFGSIASMLITTFFLAKHVRWRPSLPSFLPVRPLLRYSGYSTVNSTLNFVTGRVDNMLVGALLGTGLLGLYNRAYSLARMPVDKFSVNLGPVMFGSLSRIQDDLNRSRRLYFKATSAITTLAMPFLVALLCVGPEAVEFVYGKQWIDAGLPLQLMVPGAFLLLLNSGLRSFINAQGLVSQAIPINLAVLGVTAVGILILFPLGLVGIALAISIREGVSLALFVRLLSRSQIALRAPEIAFTAAPSFIAGAFALAAALTIMTLMVGQWAGLGMLLLLTCTAVFSTYLVAMTGLMLLWREHEYLQTTRGLITTTLTEFATRLRTRLAGHRHAARGNV